jgi:hypothetical protein
MKNKKDKRFGLLRKPTINRSGQTFGEWTLLKISGVKRYTTKTGKNKGHRTIVWFYFCKCSCGSVHTVSWPDIQSGKSTRCVACHLKIHIINSQKGIRRFGKSNPNYRGAENVPGRWLSRAKKNAEIRDIVFDVSLKDLQNQWVKQKGLCFYTGLPLIFSKEGHMADTNNHISVIASLDRVHSDKSYTKSNIVWVSKTVNRLKMDLPHKLFVKLCEMIYLYMIRGKDESR